MDSQEKIHSIIAAKDLENKIALAYKKTAEKYNFPAIRSIQDAMANKAPCLVTMRKKDSELADNVLRLMVAKTARAFNIARNIEGPQIIETVETINQEFYYLKLSEVFYVLKQAKMGTYGKMYERIDEPTIIGWFQTYANERMNMAEEDSMRKHDQHTHDEKDRQYDGYISKLHAEQSNKEETRIKNLAYAMAKKMTVTDVMRANAVDAIVVPHLLAGDKPKSDKSKNYKSKKGDKK